MSWMNCGEDSAGRPIGYGHDAICDQLGCEKAIDRGLAYACGGSHGEDEFSCEGYFCDKHRYFVDLKSGESVVVCGSCQSKLTKDGLEADE